MSDLISRQDAIEAFYEPKNGGTYAEFDDGSEWYMTSKQIYAVLESLPSAPDSRQRGEWIFKPKDAIELMFAKPKCSECGFESSDGGNFCSNCGTRMYKGGEEDET